MSINIQAKTDYSFLFSGLGGNSAASGLGGNTWLSDYASIKNGSYGKLMKAYYAKDSDDSVKKLAQNTVANQNTSSLSSAETKAYTKVQSTSDALKESADALLEKGKDSLFTEADAEKIYKAVDNFVKDYNEVLSATGSVSNNSISSRVDSMVNNTAINEKLLSKIGITVNDDDTLSLDKDTFMAADMNKVKNLFNVTGSYGYSVSASASLINYNADYAVSKAGTYTFSGTYNNAYNAGSLFNTYF